MIMKEASEKALRILFECSEQENFTNINRYFFYCVVVNLYLNRNYLTK